MRRAKAYKDTESMLDYCVAKSLRESTYTTLDDFSVADCSLNQYLDPEYDPFKMLAFNLMALTLREKYGFNVDELKPD